ncbi:putative uncharacterized protein FLJ46214 [Saccopteryx leptura]|uniref:putative uncharacterized protein FLJ46214 n=1 Tax=Saccopteryx leptura TaxID=249018 RepID=UPI00339D05BE
MKTTPPEPKGERYLTASAAEGRGGGRALAGKAGKPILGRHRWDLKPRSLDGSPGKASGPREAHRGGRQAGLGTPRPAPLLSPPPGTRDRGQRQRRLSERPRSQPGPPAAHLRVSPPPSAPTVHPAGPGGGCSDAAPTGPRAARPGLPAPGTHRVPASHRLRGAAGLQRRKERRKGCLPSPTASQPLSCGSLQFPLAQVWPRSPARESLRQRRPSRHYSPTTDTEEERRRQQWRRRRRRRREAGREQ